ncbi:PREDICTED: uncharacterized protein LOC109114401 [Nelumbo nucifera]|uniref:Uncharacterized protein LOC109114401 n=1 Tax=Nelumbo nucifera TaxID=4432 RepID=A0A1U8Q160_NELNU|nr:PREDICTED: uncharacterized protein LOC109114401 [Nelumbo nucifera]
MCLRALFFFFFSNPRALNGEIPTDLQTPLRLVFPLISALKMAPALLVGHFTSHEVAEWVDGMGGVQYFMSYTENISLVKTTLVRGILRHSQIKKMLRYPSYKTICTAR